MPTVLQIAGVVAITAGLLLVSIPVGIIAGGVFLTLIGFALGK